MEFNYLYYVFDGNDLVINEHITIYNPSVAVVNKYDRQYWMMVYLIVRRPYDDMVELFDAGIDYQSLSDHEYYLYNLYKLRAFPREVLQTLFGDLDIGSFELAENTQNQKAVLVNRETGCIIDELIAGQIVEYIRHIHFISSKIEYDVGNKRAKEYLVEKMRRKQKKLEKNEYESPILNISSSLVNNAGFKYDYETVGRIHISQLYDAFYRIIQDKNYTHTMSGVYNGCVDYSKINKDELLWFANIYKR